MCNPGDDPRHDAPQGSDDPEGRNVVAGAGNIAYRQSSSAKSPCPSHLPHEVLVPIFENVIGIDQVIRVALVCQAWREASLSTPTLWRDTRCLDRRRDEESADRHFSALLSLCDERSKSTIEYADLVFIRTAETLRDCLDILHRSKNCLLGFAIAEYAVCRCEICRQRPDLSKDTAKRLVSWMNHDHTDPDLESTAQEFADSLFDPLRATPKLEFLCVKFAFVHGLEFLKRPTKEGDGQPVIMAQPKELRLVGRLLCCLHVFDLDQEREDHIFEFFTEISQSVTRLYYDDTKTETDRLWLALVWTIFVNRAEHRERCRVPLGPLAHFCEFPVLTQGSFPPVTWLPDSDVRIELKGHQRRTGLVQNREYWFDMPALEIIHTTPAIAINIHCPAVKVAYLHLGSTEDADRLARVLRNWSELETLTISLDLHGATQGLGDSLLSAVVAMLTPSIHQSRLAPKLRHLGIVNTVGTGWFGFYTESPTWAAENWDLNAFEFYKMPWTSLVMPALPAEILELEQQRRGKKRRAAALKVIKLGGVTVEPELWRKFLDGSKATVTCFPDPLWDRSADRASHEEIHEGMEEVD